MFSIVMYMEKKVMSDLIRIDDEYKNWIQEISRDFKQSQIKAASHVNSEMLKFYWRLGFSLSERSRQASYGAAFYKTVSRDLRKQFPDTKSFSETNLRYMQYFYELYPMENLPQDGEKFQNLPQVGEDFRYAIIFKIPWGHNKLIIDKSRGDADRALFYVRKTLENNWSRAVLLNFLDTDLYERQGKAITNFDKRLPDAESDLAQQMTKDPYNFDFLTLRERYDEKELKDALMDNIQRFLLELGTGFAFVGREYRLVVGKTEQFIDELFYNIPLHCYVVIEVKTRAFDPGDMGQLGTYVAAVDGILKKDGDTPTIGLLICKTKDAVLARYALNSVNAPIGISEYELSKLVPENFRQSMPTIEEIEQELN